MNVLHFHEPWSHRLKQLFPLEDALDAVDGEDSEVGNFFFEQFCYLILVLVWIALQLLN